MGDIEPWMTEDFITKAFNNFRFYPSNVKLLYDKVTNTLRFFCFISFQNECDAKNALEYLNGQNIFGTSKTFKLNWSNPHNDFSKNLYAVYVGNLNPSVTDEVLYNFFRARYSSVTKASVKIEDGHSKRFGFVTFLKKDEYQKCLSEMDNIKFEGTLIRVKPQIKKEDNENFNYINSSQISKFSTEEINNYNSQINNSGVNNIVYNNNININISSPAINNNFYQNNRTNNISSLSTIYSTPDNNISALRQMQLFNNYQMGINNHQNSKVI